MIYVLLSIDPRMKTIDVIETKHRRQLDTFNYGGGVPFADAMVAAAQHIAAQVKELVTEGAL